MQLSRVCWKKSVEGLMEGLVAIPNHSEQIKLYRDLHLRVLKILQDNRAFGTAWTNKSVASFMIPTHSAAMLKPLMC
jgi:CCR4-NOT transcription complex subunit 1